MDCVVRLGCDTPNGPPAPAPGGRHHALRMVAKHLLGNLDDRGIVTRVAVLPMAQQRQSRLDRQPATVNSAWSV